MWLTSVRTEKPDSEDGMNAEARCGILREEEESRKRMGRDWQALVVIYEYVENSNNWPVPWTRNGVQFEYYKS
jgi:hypothetical protein